MRHANNLYIKFWRNNIFLNLTSSRGKLIFKCSCGYMSREQQKNKLTAFIYLVKLLKSSIKILRNRKINLILEGAVNAARLNLVYKHLLSCRLLIVLVKTISKIPHNGCRAKVKRTKLRKRSYLV